MRTGLIQADVTAVVLALVGIIWSIRKSDLGYALGAAALFSLVLGSSLYS